MSEKKVGSEQLAEGSEELQTVHCELHTYKSETLPRGWVSNNLIKIIQSVKTGVPEFKGEKEYYSTGSIQKDTCNSEGSYNFRNRPSRANRISIQNDVFQARMKETEKGIIISDELNEQLFSTGFLQLRPFGKTYNSKLLYYYIKAPSFLNQKDELTTGSTQEALTDTKSAELTIPLPPLNEQKRIVVKLDAIIPRIDSVKTRLNKVPALIKRFRQSVLTAAVTGKLTEKWREEHPDVESAEVLLEKIRKTHIDLYKQKKTSKPKEPTAIDENENKYDVDITWKWCRLSQVTLKMSTGPFGSSLHKSDYVPDGIPVINPTNIINVNLVPSDKMMISQTTLKRLSKYSLFENDIVIARRGDLSKCGIVTKNEVGWLCGTGSFFLKIGINSIYFRLFYVSDFCQTELNADAIGTTMANLNQKVLANTPFPLPPLEEQKEIVRQVDKLFALADKLETHYQNAKFSIDKLSQSVLAKAFRGELVPQDPNDEPAEKLLERIMVEKTKMEGALKESRKKIITKRSKK